MKKSGYLMKLRNLFVSGYLALVIAVPVMAQTHSHSTESAKSPADQQSQPAVPSDQDVPQVEISADQQKLIGVKTVKAAVMPVKKVIRTVGRVEVDESRQATINAKTEGWIEKLYVSTTGSYVAKGEKIAEIYSPELLATQQEFLTALKWAKDMEAAHSEAGQTTSSASELNKMLARDAAATLEAARQRLLLWDVSPAQIRQIEKTGKAFRTLTLYAPVSGYVTQKMVISGMKIMPGEKILDIADLSGLWVVADVYEYELPLVKVGNQATITLASLPGVELTSKIDYIYPDLSAQTRTVKVRLKLSNSSRQLKPQMFTNVEIKINLGNKLVIPESAVLDTGKAMVVYVDLGNDVFEPREVKTGIKSDGYVEVLRGLRSGEKVVAAANFLIDSEAQLKGIKPLPQQ
ncbi:MAG TPA: efflux RND transporter periplasmic adaptor subunit [Smithella sp.]|nr:efflux RND transporter periplasmic adaptor subunit [Smithella sp.]MDM7988120.1 efflux RND transporter periplasmic adaptor subunit [Smithella sp.]HNY49182.1 efflux RND transporter periplasmic adaptor subunit [Smithella sp.]HOG90058.1 efflux RND transporter periplasmic adaptor subunit [Smithella sp.]HOU49628.1 efflux RND transporter periplasmic adaptor subunit [Smithella sp.]